MMAPALIKFFGPIGLKKTRMTASADNLASMSDELDLICLKRLYEIRTGSPVLN